MTVARFALLVLTLAGLAGWVATADKFRIGGGGKVGTGSTAVLTLPTGNEWQIYLADDPANWQDGSTKQTLKDWSASANHAYRGQNVSVDSTDFTLAADGGVFDGTNDRVKSIGLSGWSGVTAASVLAVFKPTNVATYGCTVAVGVAASATSMGLCYGWPNVGSISVDYWNDDYTSSGGKVANSNWYCFIGTKAPGAMNTTTIMYLNNSVIPSSASATSSPTIGDNFHSAGKFSDNSGFFTGTLAAVIVWKRTLTAGEAADAYMYVKARLAPTGVTLP